LAPQQDSVPAASAQVNALPTAMADADVVAVDADGVAEAGVGVAGVGAAVVGADMAVAGVGADVAVAVVGADVAVVGAAVAGVGAALASVGAAVVGAAVVVVGSPLGTDPPGVASGPLGPTSRAWDGTSLGPEHAATRIRDASAAAHRRPTASYILGPHEPAPGPRGAVTVRQRTGRCNGCSTLTDQVRCW
jgi:hypothetical protein